MLGLVGSYLGIYFYPRVLPFMFMSTDAPVAAAPLRHHALDASLVCIVLALLVAVFPGWVIAQL